MKLLDYEIPKTPETPVDLDVLVVTASERNAAALQPILAAVGQVNPSTIRAGSSRPLQDEATGLLADVAILDLAQVNEVALDDIRRFVEQRGHETELFVTLPNPDTQAVKLLLQAGAADIVAQPFDPDEIGRALAGTRERLRRAGRKAGPARNALVAFMRTHATAGGSFLASNIAWQLAAEFGKNTVLVDLDVQFGTVACELDIRSDGGLLEALRNPERIDRVFLDALIVRHPSGLGILASPGELSHGELLNRKAVVRMLSVLAETYEHVVINLPLFVNDAVEHVLRQANPLFLVTQDTMSALRNLRMIIDHLCRAGGNAAQMEIVHLDGGHARDDKANMDLLMKLAGNCPVHSVQQDSKLLFSADNEGRAASELYPRAELTRDIRNIATRITGQRNDDDAAGRKSGLLRWFH